MDRMNFASDPSDPIWEPPIEDLQHTIECAIDDPRGRSERGNILFCAAWDFRELCESNPSLARVKEFLAGWQDVSGKIQPNALAWINEAGGLGNICEFGDISIVKYLLDLGFDARNCDFPFTRIRNDIVKLLVEYGWKENDPRYPISAR